jgi:hypothetical protein
MKDCVGKELNIGDKVITSDREYADLLIGEIIAFTPKKARIRYTRTGGYKGWCDDVLKETYQIFKYEDGERK